MEEVERGRTGVYVQPMQSMQPIGVQLAGGCPLSCPIHAAAGHVQNRGIRVQRG